MSLMTISVVELAVRAIPDPEIPVITLDDLGMIRAVQVLSLIHISEPTRPY